MKYIKNIIDFKEWDNYDDYQEKYDTLYYINIFNYDVYISKAFLIQDEYIFFYYQSFSNYIKDMSLKERNYFKKTLLINSNDEPKKYFKNIDNDDYYYLISIKNKITKNDILNQKNDILSYINDKTKYRIDMDDLLWVL